MKYQKHGKDPKDEKYKLVYLTEPFDNKPAERKVAVITPDLCKQIKESGVVEGDTIFIDKTVGDQGWDKTTQPWTIVGLKFGNKKSTEGTKKTEEVKEVKETKTTQETSSVPESKGFSIADAQKVLKELKQKVAELETILLVFTQSPATKKEYDPNKITKAEILD